MTEPSREKIWTMFDRISPSYDRVNRILSIGLDTLWRAKLSHFLQSKDSLSLIDLATGTGDQIFSLIKRRPSIEKAIGIDLSENMLEIARKKQSRFAEKNRIFFERQDIQNTNFDDRSFDCATLSFGIRNVKDVSTALSEIYRILKPDGRALILEFSLPSHRLIRSLYLFYLRHLLPRIGGFLSKNPEAYRYLNQTIETFPSGENFCLLLKKSGFSTVRHIPLSLGTVTLYIAEK